MKDDVHRRRRLDESTKAHMKEDALTHPTACSSTSSSSWKDADSQSDGTLSLDSCTIDATPFSYKDALVRTRDTFPPLPDEVLSEDKLSTTSNASTTSDEEFRVPTPPRTPTHETPMPPLPPPMPTDTFKHKDPPGSSARRHKVAGPRIHTSIIRGAIAHAASQGVLSKSTKREMRQSILRGETNSILENLRRECHLQPMVTPSASPPPTEYELRNSNGLLKCLNTLGPVQDSETLTSKHVVLVELDRVVDRWMRGHTVQPGHAALFVGGSWYLKVDAKDSDLDVVVLVPSYVTLADFCSELPKVLTATPGITDVICMEDAYVPTITFKFHRVKVDLLVARFSQPVVPKHLPIHSDHILANMDVTSVRALSVPRTASLILELVPHPGTFRTCLRAVRLWAKRRGLYSNKVGFLGGISWTVLVAFVCQMFPNAVAASVFHHFFSVLAAWKWPTPIMLARPYDAGLGFPQWSPSGNVHERAHAMPIITPGYPAMNSAANVTFSTLRVLREEFTRAKLILDDMQLKALTSPIAWTQLFAPSDFAVRYDHYVQLRLKGTDGLHAYSSFVASRLRRLVDILQHTTGILTVHPFPTLLQPDAGEGSYFVGFEVPPGAAGIGAAATVAPVIKYFLATEMHRMPFEGAVDISYVPWSALPNGIFPHGKDWAAGDRAKYMLSRAHNLHMAGSYYT
ncbi:Poly(A) polymerase [Achlya hypogyna]|uniref:polynucleotide adenylyltransferase n=1 Tax=Achlya hypogyna TaxID=1202772 RepID=A0A1V9YGS6_ACHHY|nr:Poly(A) polymerase [Achlya hypogyna]